MRSVSVPRAVSMMIGTSRCAAQLARQTSRPSPSGSVQVEQHEVGLDPLGELAARSAAVRGDDRLEALARERLGERLGDRRLVLDEQDRGGGRACGATSSVAPARAFPRLNPALAGAWRARGRWLCGHEAITRHQASPPRSRSPPSALLGRRRARLGRLRRRPPAARRRGAGRRASRGAHRGRAPRPCTAAPRASPRGPRAQAAPRATAAAPGGRADGRHAAPPAAMPPATAAARRDHAADDGTVDGRARATRSTTTAATTESSHGGDDGAAATADDDGGDDD